MGAICYLVPSKVTGSASERIQALDRVHQIDVTGYLQKLGNVGSWKGMTTV